MTPDKKLYVPPFRRSTLTELPTTTSASRTFRSPPLAFGLPPTVPDQRSLIARQVLNKSRFGSIVRPKPPTGDDRPLSRELENELEDVDMLDLSLESNLATPSRPRTLRERITDYPDTRPGPGPRRRPTLPSYTRVATLHLGLGDRVLKNDFDPLQDLSPRFGQDIEDVEYVGSYKWILPDESGRPTLAVPGMPDVWDPVENVGCLELDKDIPDYREFPDYAAAILPPNLSTLEPAFRSITSPSILSNVDISTGRNSLRKLWAAVNLQFNDHFTPFRIDLMMIDGMIMLERYESPDNLDPRPSQGYHLSYHETQTKKVMEGSDRTPGCIRIIKYSFGGLKMMVKFDVAAYLPHGNEHCGSMKGVGSGSGSGSEGEVESLIGARHPGLRSRTTASVINHDSIDGLSSLAEDMEGLEFDDPVYNGQSIAITYFPDHRPPPQSSLASIKTKIHHHRCDLEYYFPQHYFAQVPTLYYARHRAGDFSKFEMETYGMLDDEMKRGQQAGIDRMAALLNWIVRLVREYDKEGMGMGMGMDGGEGGGLGLVWDGRKFSVSVRNGGPQLSAPVVEMIKDARRR